MSINVVSYSATRRLLATPAHCLQAVVPCWETDESRHLKLHITICRALLLNPQVRQQTVQLANLVDGTARQHTAAHPEPAGNGKVAPSTDIKRLPMTAGCFSSKNLAGLGICTKKWVCIDRINWKRSCCYINSQAGFCCSPVSAGTAVALCCEKEFFANAPVILPTGLQQNPGLCIPTAGS